MKKKKISNSKELNEFLKKLNELVEDFHHDIYLINGVFKGIQTIEIAILDELNKEQKI